MRKSLAIALGAALLTLAACLQKENTSGESEPLTYLFLGHTYDWLFEDRIDPRLELIDYSQFDGIWLGGDICARTTKSPQTVQYLDGIFDLKSSHTLWAWGNHDLLNGNPALLEQATGRPGYYTYYNQGLLVVVLNTNLFWYYPWAPPAENCEEKERHYQWLNGILDTVEIASQLVLLHHHGLMNEKKILHGDTVALGNMDAIPVRPLCDSVRNFTVEIYPKLVALQKAGTAVTLISGDVGMRSKGYQFSTDEGIQILGSGINNSLNMDFPPDYVTNFNPDSVLLLSYQPDPGELFWTFIRLNDLLELPISSDSIRLQRLTSDY